jgi:hypothetical protein
MRYNGPLLGGGFLEPEGPMLGHEGPRRLHAQRAQVGGCQIGIACGAKRFENHERCASFDDRTRALGVAHCAREQQLRAAELAL